MVYKLLYQDFISKMTCHQKISTFLLSFLHMILDLNMNWKCTYWPSGFFSLCLWIMICCFYISFELFRVMFVNVEVSSSHTRNLIRVNLMLLLYIMFYNNELSRCSNLLVFSKNAILSTTKLTTYVFWNLKFVKFFFTCFSLSIFGSTGCILVQLYFLIVMSPKPIV